MPNNVAFQGPSTWRVYSQRRVSVRLNELKLFHDYKAIFIAGSDLKFLLNPCRNLSLG